MDHGAETIVLEGVPEMRSRQGTSVTVLPDVGGQWHIPHELIWMVATDGNRPGHEVHRVRVTIQRVQ